MGNVTYMFLMFITIKIDPLNFISHNVADYKNVSMMLNEVLHYQYGLHIHIFRTCVLSCTPSIFGCAFLADTTPTVPQLISLYATPIIRNYFLCG
jgi:hypothetical protein